MATLLMYSKVVVPLVVLAVQGPVVPVMVIVMPLLVAVAGLGQAALEVMTQVTIAPLVRVVVVNVALLVPAFTPLTFHW